MVITLSSDQVRLLRLRAQRLDPRLASISSVTQVVQDLCGLQAQDLTAATLAVRPRSARVTARDVDRARLEERSVVRTWCMRGTLHLLATEDLGWLLPLLGPVFVRASRHRYAQLGLDEDTCARGIRALQAILSSRGPLPRGDLMEALAKRGIRLEGQARPHLIRRAALEGLICLGPDRGAEPTYVLLEDWVDRGEAMPREAAVAELTHRYLAAYGPATPEDLAAWSGLSLAEAQTGWSRVAQDLLEIEVAGRSVWMLKTRTAWLDAPPVRAPVVRLVPSYDTYLLGYRSRDLIVAPQHAKRVHPGGGLLHPTLLVDGRALGTWRSRRRHDSLDILIDPFSDLTPDIQAGLEAEVRDLGRFLGVKASLSPTALDK